jgi:hypothetical protein
VSPTHIADVDGLDIDSSKIAKAIPLPPPADETSAKVAFCSSRQRPRAIDIEKESKRKFLAPSSNSVMPCVLRYILQAGKGKKKPISSPEDGGSYTDVSPYSSLTRSAGLGTATSFPGGTTAATLGPPTSAASGLTTPMIMAVSGFDSLRYRASSNSAKGHSKLPALFSSPFAKVRADILSSNCICGWAFTWRMRARAFRVSIQACGSRS